MIAFPDWIRGKRAFTPSGSSTELVVGVKDGETVQYKMDTFKGWVDARLDAHLADLANPHTVTATQVGLGNVNNTSDADKPISTATQSYVDAAIAAITATVSGALVFKGSWDASAGSFPSTSGRLTGWFYKVSVAGTVDGVSFSVGDEIFAIVDNASTTTYAGNWLKIEGGITLSEVQAAVGFTFGSLAALSSVTASLISDASANGRSFITAANYAAMKALLAISTSDVSGLGALATQSALTASLISDASANGRSFITAANYAAMKALLAISTSDVSGLGALATQSALTAAQAAVSPLGGQTSIASASTTDLSTLVTIGGRVTGTTTITSFGAGVNLLRVVTFAGALTLTHNATSLILPNNGSNITTAANDRAVLLSDASGNWTCIAYQRADGTALVASASIASQAEAQAGTDNTKSMTPLRVNNAIAYWGHAPDVIIEDQKSSGTAGGTFTSGAWQTRTLNTTVRNNNSLASLASNQITLGAGTYLFRWSAPGLFCSGHQSRLQNVTDATTVGIGGNEYSASGLSDSVSSQSSGSAVVTISGSKVFELQHRCGATRSSNGYGVAMGWGTEVYGRVEITKVA